MESITAYTYGVAYEHKVTPGTLVAQDLAQWAEIPLVNRRSCRTEKDASYFAFPNAHTLNGWGPRTEGLVAGLESGTQTKGLADLTMLRFQTALAAHRLFSCVNRWCAWCQHEWRLSRTRIYHPLIWSLEGVDACPVHGVFLEDRCSDCKFNPGPLHGGAMLGCCSQCRKPAQAEESTAKPRTLRADDRTVWRAKQVGHLLVTTVARDHSDISSCLRRNLKSCVDKVTNGNAMEFRRICGLTPQELRGFPACRPDLDRLLTVCERLDITLSSLFDSNFRVPSRVVIVMEKPIDRDQTTLANREVRLLARAPQAAPDLAALVSARDPKWPPQASGSCDSMAEPSAQRLTKERLESALRSKSIEPVKLIAKECGYKSEYKMRREFPELCAALLKKNEALSQTHWARTEVAFVKALEEEPPPSLDGLCARLKVWPDVVKRKLPLLASKIVKRAKSSSAEQHRKRLTELLSVAHLMTPKDILKALHSSAATLMKQCPQEYSAVIKLVRNPRREAVERRSARLNEIVMEQVQFEIKHGCRITPTAMHSVLPKDCMRGYAEVSVALQEARKKLAERREG